MDHFETRKLATLSNKQKNVCEMLHLLFSEIQFDSSWEDETVLDSPCIGTVVEFKSPFV